MQINGRVSNHMKIKRTIVFTYNQKCNYMTIYWSHLINDNQEFTLDDTLLDFSEEHILQLAIL